MGYIETASHLYKQANHKSILSIVCSYYIYIELYMVCKLDIYIYIYIHTIYIQIYSATVSISISVWKMHIDQAYTHQKALRVLIKGP